MSTFAVIYTYAADTTDERDRHRPEHKDFLAGLYASGRLRISGPLDGGAGALLVVEGDSADDVAATLDDDPFQKHGLLGDRAIREWTVVFGGLR